MRVNVIAVISYHIISYRIVSYRIVSYCIVSYRLVSYHIISYHIISYHIVSYLFYRILSYHIISYLIYTAVEAWNQELIEKFQWTHQRNAHTCTRRYVENMAVFQVSTFPFLEGGTSKCKIGVAAAFLDKDCRTVRWSM